MSLRRPVIASPTYDHCPTSPVYRLSYNVTDSLATTFLRSVVYDIDHLCEECHNHAHDARFGGGSFLPGGGGGRTSAPLPDSRVSPSRICSTSRLKISKQRC